MTRIERMERRLEGSGKRLTIEVETQEREQKPEQEHKCEHEDNDASH